ncbi:Rieske [2Fe-2S] iron-sulfur domain-containing protein, partial [Haematococcus lacustris]
PTPPHPTPPAGKDLVVWRDGSNTWRAFQDMCPHRLAPLSEGRVEADGSLLCAYHAWRFDGSGACTAIP